MYVIVKTSIHPCSFGYMLIASLDAGILENKLCALELGSDPEILFQNFVKRYSNPNIKIQLRENSSNLIDKSLMLVDEGIIDSKLETYIVGSKFQRSVWSALREIPIGTTCSYGDVAAKIGNPGAVRAVGTACGENPIAIFIPCHRVIKSDGSLGAYRWGTNLKNKLLKREFSQ